MLSSRLVHDPNIIDGYLVDASNTRGHAEAVDRATKHKEVAEVVRHCQQFGIPLTVTAKRTSTTAVLCPKVVGCFPQKNWTTLSPKISWVQVLFWVSIKTALKNLGSFRPIRTSRNECSIGAAIACNASGARSFKYGPTRLRIEWVEAVLPSGQVIEADRTTTIPTDWPKLQWTEPGVKTAAGFYPADNLLDLLIGQKARWASLQECVPDRIRSQLA